MSDADISVALIGHEREPVATVDDFAPDPDALRRFAAAAAFEPAGHHYPGVRAALPPDYLADCLPRVATVLSRHFGRYRRLRTIDASFSMVTSAPEALRQGQRVPHVDAYGRERIALVHYLSLTDDAGTAFFRHRSTGFETIDDERAADYFARLEMEMQENAPSPDYIADSTPLFERIAMVAAKFNRAVLYRSRVLHSGAIAADALLTADPARGRLTVTGFFALE